MKYRFLEALLGVLGRLPAFFGAFCDGSACVARI